MPVCQFDSDAPIPLIVGRRWVRDHFEPLYFSGLYLDAADVGDDQWAVMQGSTPDAIREAGTLLVKRRARTVERLPEWGGMFPVKLLPSGVVVFSDPALGGSQGISSVNDDGTVRYMDAIRASFTVPANPAKGRPHPVKLWCPYTKKGWDWVGGQDTDADRLLAYRQSTDDLFVAWVGYSPVQPTGAEHPDGTFTMAISLPGLWLHSSTFAAYAPPVVAPEPEPAPLVPLQMSRPIWLGTETLGASGIGGNCTWSPTDSRGFFEGADWLHTERPEHGPLLGLLFLPREAGHGAEDLFDLTVDTALARKVPVVLLWDGERYGIPPAHHADQRTAERWELGFEALGVNCIPCVRCYPGDHTEEAVRRLIADGADQIGLCVPVYPQAWGERAAEDANRIADQLIAAHPQIVIKLAFGRGRPGSWWDLVATYWNASVVPAAGPLLVADVPLDLPPVEVLPPPLPAPAPTKPSKGSGEGLLGRFWRWLLRRVTP